MISKVAELNRILIVLESMNDGDYGADYTNVLRQCEGTVIGGMLPDHNLSIEYAKTVGLVKSKGSKLLLTEGGKSFLELNPDKFYELSSEQKQLLIRVCYLHGPFRLQTLELIKLFSPNYEEKTFKFFVLENNISVDQQGLIEHLVQLELFIRNESLLEVNSEYVDTVASFISEGKGWTEESLEEYLKERKEVGNIAEQIVLKYEKNRLNKLGCKVECNSVRQISKLRVNAGYDIESYNKRAPNLNYDRFIEVKGAKSSKLRFFWSDNEIKIAKKLGEKYWIYFQGGINHLTGNTENELLLIQNPIINILKNPHFKTTPQGIIVEGDL